MKNKECVILVPFYNHIHPKVSRLLQQLRAKGHEVWDVGGMSAIDQARNHLAQSALNHGFKELFWLDADISTDVGNFDRIRRHNLPIVAGIYAAKDGTDRPCVEIAEYTDLTQQLARVRYAATGFLYTKSEVYQKILENEKWQKCSARFGPCHPWFLPMVHQNRYFGEDFSLCERATRAGYQIFADTTIVLDHLGEGTYRWWGAPATQPIEHLPIIFSIVDNAALLPHFIQHYLRQGVTEFIACMHPKLADDQRIAAERMLSEVPSKILSLPNTEFNGELDSKFQDQVRKDHVSKDGWYVIADLDEFHEVRGITLSEAIARAGAEHADVIVGEFRDRVTEDGHLPSRLSMLLPIERQFPFAARVTQVVTKGYTFKVLCAKGHIPIRSGHHMHSGSAWTGRGWANHYKWWGPLHEKAEKRARSYRKQGLSWANESELLVEHLNKHSGRLNLQMPGMALRRV